MKKKIAIISITIIVLALISSIIVYIYIDYNNRILSIEENSSSIVWEYKK